MIEQGFTVIWERTRPWAGLTTEDDAGLLGLEEARAGETRARLDDGGG